MERTQKTKEELQSEIVLLERLKKEREESNNLYAMKLVEKLVFGIIALGAVAVVGAILSLVLIK